MIAGGRGLPPFGGVLYPTRMRKVLMIGGQTLEPFRRGLEDDGYNVILTAPGEEREEGGQPADAVVLELGAVAEDAAAKRMIQDAPGGHGPAVIAVIDPERPASYDPALGVDDFVVT